MPTPDTTLPEQGLEVARLLYENSGSTRPKQAYLRSVKTTAYYAVFHCLLQTCADALVGTSRRNSDAWNEICRSVTHGSAKSACVAFASKPYMKPIMGFTNEFPQLQNTRIDCHYNTLKRISKADAASCIQQAEDAMEALRGASKNYKVALAVRILASGKAVNEARNQADSRRATAADEADKHRF